MSELNQYVIDHTTRGECQCGRCHDKGPDREAPKHSVNVHFFWVGIKDDPKADDFMALICAEYHCNDHGDVQCPARILSH